MRDAGFRREEEVVGLLERFLREFKMGSGGGVRDKKLDSDF